MTTTTTTTTRRGRYAGATATARTLSEREGDVLGLLAEHRVLRLGQLAVLCHLAPRGAARIVNRMAARQLVERAGRDAVLLTDWGAAVARKSYRWVSPVSAAIRDATLAARSGHDHPRLRAVDFYACLVTYVRAHAGNVDRPDWCPPLEWWTPERLTGWNRDHAKYHAEEYEALPWRADALVMWHVEDETSTYTLVFDTDSHDTVPRQRPLARRVAAARADSENWYQNEDWVLVACASPAAEAALRGSLEPGLAPVATGVFTRSYSATDAIWLPLDGTRRLCLAELAEFRRAAETAVGA